MKGIKGFSLIELMVVIAIISLLTAIAVPMFLGQREKARVRTTESSAKGAVSELQEFIDWYSASEPYMILIDSAGTQGCFEADNAAGSGKACTAAFNQTSAGTYAAFPGGLTTVISHFISHRTFKGDVSAYSGSSLFVTASAADGQILLSTSGSRAVAILAYATNSTLPVFSQIVSTR
ncbi:MAG: prepilin-type N-terminal cleavage/methylation domain-containing protein [Nitrospirae bacterium]|nr:prepilin-type N-terminal cleavage/methylation domain-containing protein [Nitrospirota bacterium]